LKFLALGALLSACDVTDGSMSAMDAAFGSDSGASLLNDASAGDAGSDGATGDGGGFAWNLPPGFPEPLVPADNPMTQEKVELGRHLFYDKRLSGNQTQSCASCHKQELAFTDGRATGLGSTGQSHVRGAMSLANVAYAATLTWANPTVTELERQAEVPMFGEKPVELGLAGMDDALLARLRADATYQRLFPAAFPDDADPFSVINVTRAVASFERIIMSGNSPFDRHMRGDDSDFSESAARGEMLFNNERFECFHCHGGFAFADSVNHAGQKTEQLFHNNALYNVDFLGGYPAENQGLYEFTQKPLDMGRFRAPTLRNVALTAPYMHDGSIKTLSEVLDHYNAGGRTIPEGEPNAGVGFNSPVKDPLMHGANPAMTEQERQDLIAFLNSLTDQEFIDNPEYKSPWPPAP
jgi:cytochrome c peroxidase